LAEGHLGRRRVRLEVGTMSPPITAPNESIKAPSVRARRPPGCPWW
jgi:hypothetical protein